MVTRGLRLLVRPISLSTFPLTRRRGRGAGRQHPSHPRELLPGGPQVPPPSGEDIYFVFLPTGTTTALLQAGGAAAVHSASVYNGTWYTYAVTRDSGTVDLLVSHEIYEAITDPYGTADGTPARTALKPRICVSPRYPLPTLLTRSAASRWLRFGRHPRASAFRSGWASSRRHD